ncbi:RnfH family protein [Comamonas odontotermitis]|uniref:RnfH family protein n=1 Tax=Comamonas odontotermitis TaxID=379895 RepID=UPI001CC79DBA|nr:RnfH family protein [Comamonas odontotermitis]UBB15634.1 RnfH family protein [Comamonas odontotermitis]
MAESAFIDVEVAWACDGQVQSFALQLQVGATVADALAVAAQRSGQVLGAEQDVGIWGSVQPRNTVLADGDRIELYQPLKVDPKKARRERFAKQGARRAGLFSRRRPQSKQGYGA